ncbi:MAG: 2-amino-4-hydroxy-6-hydroxymethyldihydropteridine diphosphokinase [Bacteroidaceae bacterium]|nr:2-amino-4-hydroxy-6-hydroxymethyldihydropteridine diphosphokinase [Bacteroidaceae bacterium]
MENRKVYLGLGTNSGNKKENLTRAIENLSLALGLPTACSTFIESEPWGFESENSFLNCVVAFDTHLSPTELLDTTEEIERRLGRTSKSHNGQYSDRTIDIDILFYGNEVINSDRLTIPHPLLHLRNFVLRPLHEIAPQLTHPAMGRTIDELLAELSK